ncbi:MAG: transcription antitermination factor NusB [Treponema sp.]|jgi:N utilization substance protein B|nr:transcription antitermination factor NusB [Treponema sp.]
MASRRKGRILAFQALYCWESTHIPVSDLITFSWLESEKQAALDEGIAGFSRLLIAGTVENIKAIDSMIKKHLQHWDFSRLNRVDLAILRISVYALMFQSGIAPSIVIDEAIGISKEFGTGESFRFVNGVLDSIRRTLQQAPAETAPVPAQPCALSK